MEHCDLVTLPMGWTNSRSLFFMMMSPTSFSLKSHISQSLISNDVLVKGSKSHYIQEDGFVWNNSTESRNASLCLGALYQLESHSPAHEILWRDLLWQETMALCSEIWVIGHYCTYEGQVADELQIAAIKNWGPCHSLSEVWAFLGTIGVLRIFIRNFAHCAHELV